MKCLDIKAGSICIFKNHSKLQRFWHWFLRKEPPYNNYIIYFGDSTMFVETPNVEVPSKDRYIILEPIKPYSKKEKKVLKEQVENVISTNLVLNNEKIALSTINTVRPNTIDMNDSISDLLKNKYYRVLYDSKKENF